jgi:DNA-binding CsgD family transcriptional regulator
MHVDPELAHRFAVRAYHATPTVAAAMELAGVLVECGEPDAARTVLLHARDTASAPVERLGAAATLAGLRCWVERDPAGAAGDLAALVRHAPDAATRADLDGLRAMALLFAGRTGQALTVAGQVSIAPGDAGAPAARRGALRAALVRATALTLLGRTAEAAEVAEKLTAAAAEDAAGLSYMPGMAHAALSLAQLWRGPDEDLPLTDPVQGRRPRRPDDRTAAPDLTGLELTAWPLFDGYARRSRGDRDGAIVRLREALVQQSAGERLFRSEASAWLTITLAEAGQVDDAAEVLTHTPPDAVAVVPGLHAWAAAAVAAARGDADTAAGCMQRALAAAEASGCALVELGYLIYAAQMGGSGGPARFAGRIAQLTGQVDAPRLVAGGEAMVALAHGDGSSLLRHAVRLDTVGLHHSALVVAEAAGRRPSGGRTTHPGEAVELAGRLRRVLGLPAAGATRATLTSREAEVVDLAAAGLSDRDIAARLVLSVRTVESHLARAYRKLGVGSRRELNSRAPSAGPYARGGAGPGARPHAGWC